MQQKADNPSALFLSIQAGVGEGLNQATGGAKACLIIQHRRDARIAVAEEAAMAEGGYVSCCRPFAMVIPLPDRHGVLGT